jgi:hypothetical protein
MRIREGKEITVRGGRGSLEPSEASPLCADLRRALLIDAEDDPYLRAELVGVLREGESR